MNQQHTPAPWELRQSVRGYWFIDYEQGGENYTLTALECKEADARLIAAAPDLLNMLRDAENWFREYDVQNSPDSGAQFLLADIRAAITKATGEQA